MSESAEPKAPFVFAERAHGVLRITGVDRIDLLHRLSTQDLRALRAPSTVCQTLFTTAQGRALAWTQVFALPDALLLVCPLTRVARLAQWIETYTIMEDVVVTDESDAWVCFEAYGQGACAALHVQPALGASSWQPCCAVDDGLVAALLPAMGPGLQGMVPKAAWPVVEDHLRAALGGLADAAWLERLRLAAGIPSAEYELSGEPNPLEYRLGAACISWKKGCYIGQEVISRLDSYDKVARLMMGFACSKTLPVTGETDCKLFADGRPIGRVTSWLATAEGCIGLALVKRTSAAPGPLQLQVGSWAADAALEDRPFWVATP